MDRLCEALPAQFASMTDFDVDSVMELQRGLERAIPDGLLDAIASETEARMEPSARKYGVSALLMGEMGYNSPSLLLDSLCANVRRGRLLKKAPASPAFVYDFDRDGNLSRVVNNDLHTTTYVVHHASADVCISISDIDEDVVSAILWLKDNLGRTSRWIQFRWYCRMKIACGMEAELFEYTDEGNTCTALSGIRDGQGALLGLARNEYRFELNPRGKVSLLQRME